jgi:hypothetical protein
MLLQARLLSFGVAALRLDDQVEAAEVWVLANDGGVVRLVIPLHHLGRFNVIDEAFGAGGRRRLEMAVAAAPGMRDSPF